ncbi:biopolymer transporter ExbD [Chamaesiphon sp.]|uniref:ExbD/TolR family protein n=1 Tax=Chamaesiphon sp. TaxID=2814140 RepID=UPI0035947AEE
MKINSGNTDQEPRIELVPLIDVIFCILTFFLLAGLQVARQQAINVDIPKASSGAPAARELLMVTLSDKGQLFLEQQPMLVPGQLIEAIKQYRQARPNSSIVLYASKQVSYNQVVEVLDALRGVAGDRVALATLPTNTTAPTPPVIDNLPGYPNPYNPYQSVNPSNPGAVNPGAINPRVAQPNPGIVPGVTPNPGAVNPTPGSSAPPQVNPTPVTQPTRSPTPIKSP